MKKKFTPHASAFILNNMTEPTTSNQIDPELLKLLRCPVTHSALRQEGDFLIAETGGLSYPVREGIPVMLAEEAKLPQGYASLDDFKARWKQQPGNT